MSIKSKLATSDIQAHSSNHSTDRSGKTVKKITIHHAVMAKASAKSIANVFATPGRNASANYCVGYEKGDICCSLYEENRAWTSSSSANDNEAITLEVANSSTSAPYPVSDETLENIIDLCVDICERYDFRLNWTGNSTGSLTVHRFFANTACPGDYLMSKMQYIADTVNAKLNGESVEDTKTEKTINEIAKEVIAGEWGNGTSRKTKLEKAGYTYLVVQTEVNAIINGTTATTTTLKSNDDVAKEVIAGEWGNGTSRKTKLEKAGYNYTTIQKIVNSMI